MCNPGTDCKWCGRKIETCERVARALPTRAEERAEARRQRKYRSVGLTAYLPESQATKVKIKPLDPSGKLCYRCQKAVRTAGDCYCRECHNWHNRRARAKKRGEA